MRAVDGCRLQGQGLKKKTKRVFEEHYGYAGMRPMKYVELKTNVERFGSSWMDALFSALGQNGYPIFEGLELTELEQYMLMHRRLHGLTPWRDIVFAGSCVDHPGATVHDPMHIKALIPSEKVEGLSEGRVLSFF